MVPCDARTCPTILGRRDSDKEAGIAGKEVSDASGRERRERNATEMSFGLQRPSESAETGGEAQARSAHELSRPRSGAID